MPPASNLLSRYAFEILLRAGDPTSLAELNTLFASAFRRVGFESFAVLEYAESVRGDTLDMLFGETAAGWYPHYCENDLASADPRVRHLLAASDPFLLSELPIPPVLSRTYTRFLMAFRHFGMEDSFVVPLHLPEGRVRCVFLSGMARAFDRETRATATSLAQGYYSAGARLLPKPEPVALLPRQIECLSWARFGKSSTDIGAILGLSARTVDEHLAHACERLGVRTRVQAVARSVAMGLVEAAAPLTGPVVQPIEL